MIFAVDFDGTIVEHKFPEIGNEIPGAIQTLKDLQVCGHKIIIWTCRTWKINIKGKGSLDEMTEWLREHKFCPDAINRNFDITIKFADRKIYADYYFDDRSFPPFSGWDTVREKFILKKIKKYTILFIDSQGKISARDENHCDRIFDTVDYPNAKRGYMIEVAE